MKIMKNFIKFGIQKNNKTQKIYEEIKGNLYDTYMLGRYFEDIYNLSKLEKKKVKFSKNLLHDTKDLKFNLVNYILLLISKKKKFYEFGFTLYEKIIFLKFFNNLFNQKFDISKIKFFGNDISDRFIFFTQNFYKDFKISVSKKILFKNYSQSIFFSKGVTLLYEKQNFKYLKNFIKYSQCGSFDISLYPKKKIRLLETGYKLYYPSIISLINLINSSPHKKFYFRNKKKVNGKIYIEILFGDENIASIVNSKFKYLSKKNIPYKNYLSLNKEFKELTVKDLK